MNSDYHKAMLSKAEAAFDPNASLEQNMAKFLNSALGDGKTCYPTAAKLFGGAQ